METKKLFTYNAIADTITLLNIDDDDILVSTCKVNKYALSLCNDHFWLLKIQQLLPGFEFPFEFKNKGEDLYFLIKYIEDYFDKEEPNYEEDYYDEQDYTDYDYYGKLASLENEGEYDDLNNYAKEKSIYEHNISIAGWATKYNSPGLLQSMIKLGYYPTQNYVNDATEMGYSDVIEILINNDLLPDLEAAEFAFRKGYYDTVILLLDTDGYQDYILEEIGNNVTGLQWIIDNSKLTQSQINNLFLNNSLSISKLLIKNKLYPDKEGFELIKDYNYGAYNLLISLNCKIRSNK